MASDGVPAQFLARRQLDGGEHLRLELSSRIGHLDPRLDRAGLVFQVGVDVGDFSLQHLVDGKGNLHHGRLPHLDPWQFVFVDVGVDPDPGDVGDLQQLLAGHDAHPGEGLLLGHDAAVGAVQSQGLAQQTGLLQFLNLLLGDVPIGEARAGGLDQAPGAVGDLGEGAVGEAAAAVEGELV